MQGLLLGRQGHLTSMSGVCPGGSEGGEPAGCVGRAGSDCAVLLFSTCT